MENKMHHHHGNIEELIGAFAAFFGYKLTLLWHFPLLQIHGNPFLSEIMIDTVRLIFTVLAAGAGYLFVHWLKKNVTHEK